MHLTLSLFNFTQWKDKCTSYSFTTKKLTHSMCQVSLVVKYIRKMLCNNSKLDLVYMNAYIKFGEILPIGSQDIEKKRNFAINQGP